MDEQTIIGVISILKNDPAVFVMIAMLVSAIIALWRKCERLQKSLIEISSQRIDDQQHFRNEAVEAANRIHEVIKILEGGK